MIFEKATESAEFIRYRFPQPITTAAVLGSGLGSFADEIENKVVIPYDEIPHFAVSTVEGHAGRLVLGTIAGIPIAVQQGRFHYYEGYSMEQVTFPMRVFGRLGVNKVIITNAAGSLDPEMRPGSLMLITDHINCMGVNPLRGENDSRFGPRFPDMTEVYDKRLAMMANEIANEISEERFRKGEDKVKIDFLHRGIYCALSGPTYETPAEVRMYRLLGANAVGMSTVPEAVTARHQGMSVVGISCISNFAAGMTGEPINHSEVMETGERVSAIFKEMLRRLIVRMN